MKMISLVRKDDYPEPMNISVDGRKPTGPSLYSSEGADKLDFPSEGTAMIRFKKIGSSERTNSEGETEYTCDLEILSVGDIKAIRGSAKKEDGRAALDRLKAEKEAEHEEY